MELFSHTHKHENETYEVYFAKVRWYINATNQDNSLQPIVLWQFDA